MTRTSLITFLILFFVVEFIRAQNPFIELYTTDDGLPSNTVNIVSPDNEKFLWIATDGGLVRYNGSSFRKYSSKDGLVQNKVLVIKTDSFKRTWLFCMGSQLNYYYQGRIYNKTGKPFLDSLRGTWNFTQDTEGNLYFFNYHSRMIKVLDRSNHVKFYELPGIPFEYDSITDDGMNIQCLARVPSGEFVIWTYTGIYKTRSLSEKPAQITVFKRYQNIHPVNDTLVYGAIAYPETHSSVLIRYVNGNPEDTIKFAGPVVDDDCSIMQYTDEITWISSPTNGLYCLKDKEVIFYIDLKDIYWMCKDHEGNIWAASEHGAYKISPCILLAKHFDKHFFNNGGVDAITSDPDGRIWGLSGNKLFLLSNDEFFYRDISYSTYKFREITGLRYNSLIIGDGNSNLFGITGISPEGTGKTLKYVKFIPLHVEKDLAYLTINKTKDLASIHDVYKHEIATYSVKDNFRKNEQEQIKFAPLVFYDPKDRLVVLELREHYYLQNKQKVPCTDYSGLPAALPLVHNTLDTSADVFLSMYDSLYFVNNGKVFNLTSSFDYSFNTPIKRIAYQRPAMYLSTSRNIFICDDPLNITGSATMPLNLIDINFSDIRDLFAYKDSLYIASGDGLTIIPINAIDHIRTLAPVPYFASVLLNDRETDPYSGKLTFRGKNKISIEFGSINYSGNPELFSYMMKGIDDGWNIGPGKSIIYANLPAGHYTFLLKAAKSNSPWSDPVELDIVVRTTIWQHPIFFICLSILVVTLIFTIILHRKNILMKKREIEYQLVNLEQKALQSMMNPHFIFNSLGSIQNFLLQKKTGEAGLYLSQFARLIRQNLNAIKETMISLDDETDRLKNYLDLEKMRLKNKFEYTFEVDESLESDEILIPSMLVQPLVENAIWHGITPLEEPGFITMRFQRESGLTIRVIVEDNGVGIKKSETYSANNKDHLRLTLILTRKRIDLLGRKFKVPARIDFTEAFPGRENPGTRVEMIIPFAYSGEVS